MKDMNSAQKEQLKKVWNDFSFDEIIDAGFDNNKCSAMHLINAADEFKNKEKNECSNFVDVLDDFIESYGSRNLPWINEIMDELVLHYSEDSILDYFDNNDLIEHLDGTWELDKYVEEKSKEAIIEDIETHKTTKEDVLRSLSNLNKYDFKRFLCDITESIYSITDEELIAKIKLKLNK